MKLYDNRFSPNAKRPRVCAAELGIDLEIVPVDFAKGDPRRPEYLAKNPMGKVPTLEDDGYVLWESPAMLVYLATKHPDRGLLPSDPRGRADAMRWMFWNASHLESGVFTVGFERVIKPMMGGAPDELRVAAGQKEVDRYAPILNAHLEGKPWMLGGAFSIADIDLGTTVEFGAAVGIDLGPYPHVAAWLRRLQAREAWQKAS